MISEMAISDVEDLEARGLHPSPRDVVRLNALGLLIERAKNAGDVYELPRVAYLGKLSFREPTVGHTIWIDSVLDYVNRADYSTYIAVCAFALARRFDALPDAADKTAVVAAIDAFTKNELSPFTFPQVSCAVTYALHGADQVALEFPEPPKDETPTDELKRLIDPAQSVGCGIVLETLAIGLGVSVREIMGLTVSGARKLQSLALMAKGIDSSKGSVTRAQADYFRTLGAITARLEKEKDNGGK